MSTVILSALIVTLGVYVRNIVGTVLFLSAYAAVGLRALSDEAGSRERGVW